MNYRLGVAQPLKNAVPAIAAAQLDAAMILLRSADRDHDAIHAARRHFKRTRALLDLVRPMASPKALETGRKNLRAAAQGLAASRDAHVAYAAAEALERKFDDPSLALVFDDLKSWLQARCDRIEETFSCVGVDDALSNLKEAKRSFSKLGLRHATMNRVFKSAADTYRRGRRAMRTALASNDDEAMHAWRKQTQQHWRHMRLLRETWPKQANARAAMARRLSGILGTHHDLAVLRQLIRTNREVFRAPAGVQMLCRCIEKRQASLERKAVLHGERLYAEKPKAFLKRLKASTHNVEAAKARHSINAAA
jgi:hypothetical protein